MNDLDIIKKLEKKLKVKLTDFTDSDDLKGPGYRLNDQGRVESLSLYNCNVWNVQSFNTIVSALKQFPELFELDLSKTFIRGLSFLAEFTRLTILNLSSNDINDITPLAGLNELQFLDLTNNSIEDITPLENLVLLRGLILESNLIEDVTSLGGLMQLEQLILEDNLIENIAPLESLAQLTSLDLDDNKISDISSLKTLTNLERLHLSENEILNITALKNLTSLHTLGIRSNYISNIAPLKKLVRLNTLTAASNKISHLSPLSGLKKLKKLELDRNEISDLSPLEDLVNLTELTLTENKIATINPLKNLKLQILDIEDNPIDSLPVWITDWDIPIEWDIDHPNDNCIKINGQFHSPPTEVIKQGKEAIRLWFSGDKQRINEVKVMLVGHGDVGKTSLVNCIKGEKINEDVAPTHHINISSKVFQHNQKSITFHFWDFGGQEVMHSTHQFFLSRRSIYILVLDGRRDEDPEYWLKHIESFGGNSPVIVVLNKTEDANPSYDVDRRFLKEKYPFIVGFYRTVCKGDIKGMTEVIGALTQALEKVDLLSVEWLEGWVKVKTELEGMPEDFISQSSYEKICIRHNVVDAEEQELLAGCLNDLGIIVHFKELRLADLHILQPRWASRAAYKIINSGLENGILNMDKMPAIMKKKGTDDFDYKPPSYPFILDLMKKFELCYPIVENQQYLIPALLNIQQPELPEHTGPVLRFFFEYEDILPRSIMLRFIVRMHTDIHNNSQWRTGVVLKVDIFETIAIVIADMKEKRISISISGPQRLLHFAIIRKTFHELHKSFEKLRVTEWVPLPDVDGHEIEYEELRGYEKMGEEKYLVGKLMKYYKVKDLLNGIELESARKDEYDWDVFICHSSKDKDIIREIIKDMREKGIRYWLDEEQIQPGNDVIEKITDGLQKSRNIATCISADQIKSGWCKKEYHGILGRVISGTTKQNVIPLILDNTKDEDIPLFLGSLKYEKYREAEQYERFMSAILKSRHKDNLSTPYRPV